MNFENKITVHNYVRHLITVFGFITSVCIVTGVRNFQQL